MASKMVRIHRGGPSRRGLEARAIPRHRQLPKPLHANDANDANDRIGKLTLSPMSPAPDTGFGDLGPRLPATPGD